MNHYQIVLIIGMYDDRREYVVFSTVDESRAMATVDMIRDRITNYKVVSSNPQLEQVVELFFGHYEEDMILMVRQMPAEQLMADPIVTHYENIDKPESYQWWERNRPDIGCEGDPVTEFEAMVEAIEDRFDQV